MQKSAFDIADGWPVDTTKKGWLGHEITREQISHQLTPEELPILRRLVDRCKASGKSLEQLTREDFSDPALDESLARAVRLMKTGLGLSMITGVPMQDYTLDELRILYWGIGSHFGVAVSQNLEGELMGEVRVRANKIKYRAYSKAGALDFHTDRIDILSLFSIQTAKSGGATVFKSALAVWEAVERERPDLLPILKRGFYQYRSGEQPEGEDAVTSHRVPIFGEKDGLNSCLFSANASLAMVQNFSPEPLTAEEEEALRFVDGVRNREELAFPVLLQPGEMVFLNNYELLHGREDFEDGEAAEEKRFLLRLWLQGRPGRPKPQDMIVVKNKSGLQGIDPKPALRVHEAAEA